MINYIGIHYIHYTIEQKCTQWEQKMKAKKSHQGYYSDFIKLPSCSITDFLKWQHRNTDSISDKCITTV